MKTVFVSAVALIVAANFSSAIDCDLPKIEGLLYSNATKGLAKCENATGIGIFTVNQFPTLDQVALLSQNVNCANYLNQINQVANADIQCNITIDGVPVNFATLITDFLSGKTGNESDASSGSIEFLSDTASESMDSDIISSGSTSTSLESSDASSSRALSFDAFGYAAVFVLALQ